MPAESGTRKVRRSLPWICANNHTSETSLRSTACHSDGPGALGAYDHLTSKPTQTHFRRSMKRQEDVKTLTLDIEETKEMLEDKKNQVEVLSNSVNALQDDKNHLVRKLQHLEGQLRVANDEIDTVQTSSQMKISELQRSLVDVTKESERYRSKHQDLKRLMLREASEVVAERFVANKFDNKKFENAMEQSFDKL